MRLLLDQGTPRSTAKLLTDAGFDAVHTADLGLAEADDTEIIEAARDDDRVVITLDSDFHTILAITRATKPSVIRLRIQGLNADDLSLLVQYVLSRCADDLINGAMISVTEIQVRIRRLPVF